MAQEPLCMGQKQPPNVERTIGSYERQVNREHVARGRPEPAREDARQPGAPCEASVEANASPLSTFTTCALPSAQNPRNSHGQLPLNNQTVQGRHSRIRENNIKNQNHTVQGRQARIRIIPRGLLGLPQPRHGRC